MVPSLTSVVKKILKKIRNVNLARLCARLKSVFLSKKGPSKARLLTKMSPSEELGTLQLLHHSAGGGYGMTSVL